MTQIASAAIEPRHGYVIHNWLVIAAAISAR
jgi:hypothetical protein